MTRTSILCSSILVLATLTGSSFVSSKPSFFNEESGQELQRALTTNKACASIFETLISNSSFIAEQETVFNSPTPVSRYIRYGGKRYALIDRGFSSDYITYKPSGAQNYPVASYAIYALQNPVESSIRVQEAYGDDLSDFHFTYTREVDTGTSLSLDSTVGTELEAFGFKVGTAISAYLEESSTLNTGAEVEYTFTISNPNPDYIYYILKNVKTYNFIIRMWLWNGNYSLVDDATY